MKNLKLELGGIAIAFILTTLILTILFSGCTNPDPKIVDTRTNELLEQNIIVVDGCQYYVYRTYMHNGFVHKGNCNNPIHKCN